VDELTGQVSLLRVLARRAPGGPPKAEPGAAPAAAERSGAALIFSITKDYSAACWPEALS